MTFSEQSNLKHTLKTRQINQKRKKIYLQNLLTKHGYPPRKDNTIERFIKATNNEINREIVHIKPPKYSNLEYFEENKKL